MPNKKTKHAPGNAFTSSNEWVEISEKLINRYYKSKSKNKDKAETIQDISAFIAKGNHGLASKLFWENFGSDIKSPVTISSETSSMPSNKKVDPDELNIKDSEEVKDFKNLVEEMELTVSSERTRVFLVAINKKKSSTNKGCYLGSREGEPFGGYVYDRENDAYYIECIEHMDLGFVSCSFSLSLPHIGNWVCDIPLPVTVIKRYLNDSQQKLLEFFEKKFKKYDFEIQFIQMRS